MSETKRNFIQPFRNKNISLILKKNGCKPEKKQSFKKLTCKFLIDYCGQSSSDNLCIKLLTLKLKKNLFIN